MKRGSMRRAEEGLQLGLDVGGCLLAQGVLNHGFSNFLQLFNCKRKSIDFFNTDLFLIIQIFNDNPIILLLGILRYYKCDSGYYSGYLLEVGLLLIPEFYTK